VIDRDPGVLLTSEEDRSRLSIAADEAQEALRQRPSFTIRARLGVGLVFFLLGSVVVTVTMMHLMTRIKEKVHFLEAAQSYMFEIQQARRFEKNFLLYGTNLDDALEHVRSARRVLELEREDLGAVVGAPMVDSMADNLGRYENVLSRLRSEKPTELTSERREQIEAELRELGSTMVSSAEQYVSKERHAVEAMLAVSQRIPIPFLVMLILVAVYLLFFVGRQMLAPLGRMMEATRRIAEGDFTPITPQRRYHDEFSDLAMALNHMMHQLVQRQDLLVRAHKLKAVGTLTAGVAHELNNPINNIMVTACLLEEDYEDYSEEERIDMIQDLVSESERAQGIVRNLLDFARETDPDIEPLGIQQLVEEVLRLASNQIKLGRVKVRGEVESQLPPVFGDAQQLKQVFLNHVLNAVDAMPDGGTLSINIEKGKNRDFLMVEIADTGTGIPQHQLNNIFDPFFTTKSKSKGTGLGLAVSLSIVKKHGGDISVRSQVGRGTTFTVILPAAKVPADLTAAGA
jgi:two-component system NtrC family sensor kinase